MPWHRERSSFSLYDVLVRRGRERRGEGRRRKGGRERERADNQRSLSRGRELEKLCEILRTEWDKGTEREREREREEKISTGNSRGANNLDYTKMFGDSITVSVLTRGDARASHYIVRVIQFL